MKVYLFTLNSRMCTCTVTELYNKIDRSGYGLYGAPTCTRLEENKTKRVNVPSYPTVKTHQHLLKRLFLHLYNLF